MNSKVNVQLAKLGLCATLVLLTACPATQKAPSEAGDPQVQGDKPMTGEAAFDAEALREKLQGHWRVRRGERVLFEFSFQGEQATVVDRRFTTAREVTGPLKLRSATGFGITDADGSTYYYSAVFDGDEVFMGLGAAIETEEGEAFTARIGAWERLVRETDQEGCKYIKTWGGSTSEESVDCELKQKGDRTVFSYQSEDPFRPGKLKTYELTVVGDYLLGKELAESRAEPFDPSKEPKTEKSADKTPPVRELLVALPDSPPPEVKRAAPATPKPGTAATVAPRAKTAKPVAAPTPQAVKTKPAATPKVAPAATPKVAPKAPAEKP